MQIRIFITLTVFILLYQNIRAQNTINYGSNKGLYETVKGSKIYYETYGSGAPLLLIHGGLSSISSLAPVIPELAKKFKVIAVDCPGQGRSEMADSLSYQLMADFFSTFIDQLKFDSIYVLGYSDGGNIALLLAADRPEKVKKVAAFAAAANTSGYFPEATGGLSSLNPEMVEKQFTWWLKPHLQMSPQPEKWKKFIVNFRKMCLEPVIVPDAKLHQILCPVLLMQGDNDIVRPEHTLVLHAAIAGSQLCIVPATSHFILYEKPALFNQIVAEFFEKEPKLFSFTSLNN